LEKQNLGSQSRRSNPRRGGSSGGNSGGSTENSDDKAQRKIDDAIYQRAFKKLDNALSSNNFSYAAEIATSISISKEKPTDLVNLLIASAKAFSEAKERSWAREERKFTDAGLRFAQEKTGSEISTQRREQFGNIIESNLKKITQTKGGSPRDSNP
jgi:hypothetical protein